MSDVYMCIGLYMGDLVMHVALSGSDVIKYGGICASCSMDSRFSMSVYTVVYRLHIYNPLIIFHRMIKEAMGNRIIDTPIQAKRTPKSRPMREYVPNRMVRSASTTGDG